MFVTSLIQTAGHKMAVLMQSCSRDFQTSVLNQWDEKSSEKLLCLSLVYSLAGDRAQSASIFVSFPLN